MTVDETTTRIDPHAPQIAAFRELVLEHHRLSGRHDHPWRRTRDPYAVLVSEVMLQQTQVARVLPRYLAWMERFPTPSALADAPLEAVLESWQGLGYNRRAISLKRTAEEVVARHGGAVPRERDQLLALPGIGPSTAAGVRAFAYGEPDIYLETNVRAAFLHHFFADAEGVPDRELLPYLEAALDRSDPRTWYWALLDYGAHLKRTLPNPSRRSAHHARQSPFEGSRRQKRAALLRAVLGDPGLTADEYEALVPLVGGLADELLGELAGEGFLAEENGRYRIA